MGVIDLLLSHGASLELRNEDDQTAEDVTEDQNITGFLNEWKVNTAKILLRDEDGKTLLHKAVVQGSIQSILDCLKYGSDINARDNSSWTPLHEACLAGNAEIVELLLCYGAEIDAQALDQDTPLHQASANNFTKVVKILLCYGADPNRVDVHGRLPSNLAEIEQVKNLLLAPKEDYLPHKFPKYLPRLASEVITVHTEDNKQSEMDWSNANDDASSVKDERRNSASFASTREEKKFQALLKKLAQTEEQSSSSKNGLKESKRNTKIEAVFYSSDSDSENSFNSSHPKSKSQGKSYFE